MTQSPTRNGGVGSPRSRASPDADGLFCVLAHHNGPIMHRLADNRYRVVGPLGSGGMADVYLACDVLSNRDVALKVFIRRYAEAEEFVQRFEREARNAAALSHPNIVPFYTVGERWRTGLLIWCWGTCRGHAEGPRPVRGHDAAPRDRQRVPYNRRMPASNFLAS